LEKGPRSSIQTVCRGDAGCDEKQRHVEAVDEEGREHPRTTKNAGVGQTVDHMPVNDEHDADPSRDMSQS